MIYICKLHWNLIDKGAADTDFTDKDYTKTTAYSAKWEVHSATIPINAYEEFLPEDKTFYHYEGSLTTYPCSNGINWFLFQQPLYITPADLENLQSAVSNEIHTLTFPGDPTDDSIYHATMTNRPIQPVGGRSVWYPELV